MKNLTSLLLVGLLILTSCSNNNSNTTEKNSKNSNEWYEGGNLHNAKISDWKGATYKNKLATCADFVAKVDNPATMEILKDKAKALMICIDESTKDIDNTNNESVSRIAALCFKLIETK